MKEQYKNLWVEKLESGEFRQAESALFDGVGYCCLGVLAKVTGCGFYQTSEENPDVYAVEHPTLNTNINAGEQLSPEALAEYGFTAEQQQVLMHLNDGTNLRIYADDPEFEFAERYAERRDTVLDDEGRTILYFRPHTFAEIAAIIREHL